MYYMDKLIQHQKETRMSINEITKLLQRICKFYNLFDQFMKVFIMIKKKDRIDSRGGKDPKLYERLIIAVQLLLKENPSLLSEHFIFKGSCILSELRDELDELGIDASNIPPHNPRRLTPKRLTDGRFSPRFEL